MNLLHSHHLLVYLCRRLGKWMLQQLANMVEPVWALQFVHVCALFGEEEYGKSSIY